MASQGRVVSTSATTSPAVTRAAPQPFELKQVDSCIYRIRERFFISENRANIWLVQGTKYDLVVDAGLGLWDLPSFLKQAGVIGTKPVLAVATHVHFDHSGGLHQFKQVAIHELEAEALARGDNFSAATCITSQEITQSPNPYFRVSDYAVPPTPPSRLLHDGDRINLGNRKFEVLHLPGHSPGSIALLDRRHGILFSGDVVYRGSLLDWLPNSNVNAYIVSCRRLSALAATVRRVYPGHFDSLSGQEMAVLVSEYIERASTGCCYKTSQSFFSTLTAGLLHARHNPICFYGCCMCWCQRMC